MLNHYPPVSGLHKGYDFNETILLAYNELISSSAVLLKDDYNFQGYSLSEQSPLLGEQLTSEDLRTNLVLPVFTQEGITKVRTSIKGLNITTHKLVRSHDVTIFDGILCDRSTAKELEITGSYFSGSFRGSFVYGYVSVDEIKAMSKLDTFKDIGLLKSLLLETSLYRAFQRVDHALLSEEFKQFKYIHDLRNFTQFRSSNINDDLYIAISEVINSRKDYLISVSRLWRKSFSAQMSFLSYSLAEVASKYNLTKSITLMYAYKLAGEVAMADTNLSPVSGDSYILALVDPDSAKVELVIKETVVGRLKRCYSKASLKSVRADVVYDSDKFVFNSKEPCEHATDNYNDTSRGDITGSYCTLTFNDNTHISVYVEAHELDSIALCSGLDVWNGPFSERMKIKQAISSALSLCDWSYKSTVGSNYMYDGLIH